MMMMAELFLVGKTRCPGEWGIASAYEGSGGGVTVVACSWMLGCRAVVCLGQGMECISHPSTRSPATPRAITPSQTARAAVAQGDCYGWAEQEWP